MMPPDNKNSSGRRIFPAFPPPGMEKDRNVRRKGGKSKDIRELSPDIRSYVRTLF
jgi:hypothetical protein